MFTRHYEVWPSELPKTMTLPETSVFTNLEIATRRYPDHTAIVFYDTAMTYRSLLEEVEAMAGYLQSQGVGKGDRVLLYMQNAPQYVISYYAILRADAVVIPINPMNRSAELEHYIADTDAAVCLAGQELAGFIAPLVGQSNLKQVVVAAYSTYVREPTEPAGGSGRATAVPGASRLCQLAGRSGREAEADASYRRSRRSGGHTLQLGHHRRPQRLHAHPPLGDGDPGTPRLLEPEYRRFRAAGDPAIFPRYRHAGLHEQSDFQRFHPGDHDPLGPQYRRQTD